MRSTPRCSSVDVIRVANKEETRIAWCCQIAHTPITRGHRRRGLRWRSVRCCHSFHDWTTQNLDSLIAREIRRADAYSSRSKAEYIWNVHARLRPKVRFPSNASSEHIRQIK
jgi:hypothetical protein